MTVVVMVLFALAHRNDAAVGYFAHYMLELDSGVDNAKVMQ